MSVPLTKDDIYKIFEMLDISVVKHEHSALFTVEDSQKWRGKIEGGHCKSLFLKDKKHQLYLIVCCEDSLIDLKQLPKKINSQRISFGNPTLLKDVLGVMPGAVTPLSLVNDTEKRVKVILEKKMMQYEILNYHPLVNTETVSIYSRDLLRFIEYTEHEYTIMSLTS